LKIVYLFTNPSINGSSVQTKVLSQINRINSSANSCKGVFFIKETNVELPKIEGIEFIKYPANHRKLFKDIAERKNLDKAIYNYVNQHYNNVDYFYFRYPGASRFLFKTAKKFGKKIVSEHQGKEIAEILSASDQNPFGLRPSKLIGWIQYQLLPLFNEKIWGVYFAKKVKSIVAVTEEIGIYQKNKGCKNVIVSPNGINVSQFPIRKSPVLGDEIRLLFLKGTAGVSAWNGLDRITNSLQQYYLNNPNPSDKIKLLIGGHILENEVPDSEYIEQLGYLNKDSIDKLVNQVHLGVSTMALYKKNLEEAAVLKTREYIARGLPFIYAAKDPDLNEDASAFSLKFSNDETLIDMIKVIEFAKKVNSDPLHPQKMRAYAEKHLDYKAKMKKLIELLINIK
jgi:hypothetical protein